MLINKLVHDLGKLSMGMIFSLAVWAASEPGVPLPTPPKAKGPVSATQSCVAPIEEIRRFHGQYLQHQRDETMHLGIRTKPYSLVKCIECHVTPDAQGKFPHIRDTQHFCKSCHAYAAVTIDCFQCHASQPPSLTESSANLQDSLGTSSTLPR